MQRQIEKVFEWVAEKNDNPDIMLRMYPDFSGDIVDERYARSGDDIIFAFDHIMDVIKADVDNFDYENWLNAK